MAQDFAVEIDDKFQEFAVKAVSAIGVGLPIKMVQAAQVLQAELVISTSSILKKYSKGTLKRGWTVGPLRMESDTYAVDVFNMVPYAAIHEEGGVIRPKRVKALAVPNRDYRPIIKNGSPIAPRDFDPGRNLLKFYPAIMPGKLRGYLVDKDTGELAYTLMAHVRIKPTGYISKGLEMAEPQMVEMVGDALVTAMGEAV